MARLSFGHQGLSQTDAALARCKDELQSLAPDQLPNPFPTQEQGLRRPQAEQEFSQLKFNFLEECTNKLFLQGCEDADPRCIAATGGRLNNFGPTTAEIEKGAKRAKDENRAVKEELRKEVEMQFALYEELLEAHSELKSAREKCVQELRSASSAQDTLNKVQASKAASPPESRALVDAELKDVAKNDQDFGAKLKQLREENKKHADAIMKQEAEKRQLEMELSEQRSLDGRLKARIIELEAFQGTLDQLGLFQLGIDYRDGLLKPHFKVLIPGASRREAVVSTQFDPQTGQLRSASTHPDLGLRKECLQAVQNDDLPQLLTEVANCLEPKPGHHGGA